MAKTIHTPEYRLLTQLLRQLRTQAGLRQKELADMLGKPQSYVSKYESGERRLDVVELRQICQALGVTLPEVIQRWEDWLA